MAVLSSGLGKSERGEALDAVRQEVQASLAERIASGEIVEAHVAASLDSVVKAAVRRRILEEGVRPDGRDTTTIRPISVQVGRIPRVHGSGLFMRGETHVLTIATLGTPGDAQRLDRAADRLKTSATCITTTFRPSAPAKLPAGRAAAKLGMARWLSGRSCR